MKKPSTFGLVLLGLFIGWGVLRNLRKLMDPVMIGDKAMLDAISLGWLTYPVYLGLFLLGIVCIYILIKPQAWGTKALYMYLGVSAGFQILAAFAGFAHPETAVGQKALGAIAPAAFLLGLFFYLPFYLVAFWYVHRHRAFLANAKKSVVDTVKEKLEG